MHVLCCSYCNIGIINFKTLSVNYEICYTYMFLFITNMY